MTGLDEARIDALIAMLETKGAAWDWAREAVSSLRDEIMRVRGENESFDHLLSKVQRERIASEAESVRLRDELVRTRAERDEALGRLEYVRATRDALSDRIGDEKRVMLDTRRCPHCKAVLVDGLCPTVGRALRDALADTLPAEQTTETKEP